MYFIPGRGAGLSGSVVVFMQVFFLLTTAQKIHLFTCHRGPLPPPPPVRPSTDGVYVLYVCVYVVSLVCVCVYM